MGEIADGTGAGDTAAGFVECPASLKVALGEVDEAEGVTRVGVGRVEGECGAIGGGGFVEAAEVVEGDAEGVVGFGVVGKEEGEGVEVRDG